MIINHSWCIKLVRLVICCFLHLVVNVIDHWRAVDDKRMISHVFLLLCLCILIVIYAVFCISCFHPVNWHSSATLTEVFSVLFPQL